MTGHNLKMISTSHTHSEAESRCKSLKTEAKPRADIQVNKLLHELQVHQVELEMQNSELQQTRSDLESSLASYADLYDFAPIGYFTICERGCIHNVNLTGAEMLGLTRSSTIGQCFDHFVKDELKSDFLQFVRTVFSSTHKEECETIITNALSVSSIFHITATTDAQQKTCRLIMVNVDKKRKIEQELHESREQLRQLAGYQERVKEDERKRIAREIHDDLGQNLLALRIDISMLYERTGDLHPKLHKKVGAALQHLDATIKAVRSTINNLRPSVLDLGLHAAIEWQVQEFKRRHGIACELCLPDNELILDDDRAVALFRILQESLNNVVRHANANKVKIHLYLQDNTIHMQVKDDGIGIFPDCRRKANVFGLIGMKERIHAYGGDLLITSEQDNGTTLTALLPLF